MNSKRLILFFVIIVSGAAILRFSVFSPDEANRNISHDRDLSENYEQTNPLNSSVRITSNSASNSEKSESVERPNDFSSPELTDYFDPSLMKSNSVYVARVKKHLALKYYHSSPAKDTAECEQIRQLIAQEGLGLDVVPDAYNAAWDYFHQTRMIESGSSNKTERQILAKTFRDSAISRLRLKYGITNSHFYDALFEIKPTVFFGQANRSIQPGEPLLQ